MAKQELGSTNAPGPLLTLPRWPLVLEDEGVKAGVSAIPARQLVDGLPSRPVSAVAKLMCFSTSSNLFSSIFSESAQTGDGGLGGHSSWGGQLPRSTGDLATSLLALPDADGLSLDAILQALGAR